MSGGDVQALRRAAEVLTPALAYCARREATARGEDLRFALLATAADLAEFADAVRYDTRALRLVALMMRAVARHAAAPARCRCSQARALDISWAVEQWLEGLQDAAQAAAQHAAEDQEGPAALVDGLGMVACERCGTPGTWWVLNSGAGLALCDYCAGPEGLDVGREAAHVAAVCGYEVQHGGQWVTGRVVLAGAVR